MSEPFHLSTILIKYYFIDWVTVKLSELHYGLTVSMLKKNITKLLCLCTKIKAITFAVKPQAAPTQFSDTIFLIAKNVNKGCWFVEGNQFCSLVSYYNTVEPS